MARIVRTDPLLGLLRARLQQDGAAPARPGAPAAPPVPSPVQRARAMAAIDPDARRRRLIGALLAERLGEGVANDAAFQRIGDRVLAMLEDMPDGQALIAAALTELEGEPGSG